MEVTGIRKNESLGGWQEERVDANRSLALDVTDFEMLKGLQSFGDARAKAQVSIQGDGRKVTPD